MCYEEEAPMRLEVQINTVCPSHHIGAAAQIMVSTRTQAIRHRVILVTNCSKKSEDIFHNLLLL